MPEELRLVINMSLQSFIKNLKKALKIFAYLVYVIMYLIILLVQFFDFWAIFHQDKDARLFYAYVTWIVTSLMMLVEGLLFYLLHENQIICGPFFTSFSVCVTKNAFKAVTILTVIAKSGCAMVVLKCQMMDIVTITAAFLVLICFVLLEKATRDFILQQNTRDQRNAMINGNDSMLSLMPVQDDTPV